MSYFFKIAQKVQKYRHVNFPPPPIALYLPLIDFRLQSLAIPPRYQAAVFSLADASFIVLDNSFRKHSAIIFH